MSDLRQLDELVTREPLPHARPDVAALIRHGRRLQHRRRATYGAIGVVAATVVTGGLVAGHGPGSGREAGVADTTRLPSPTPHPSRHTGSTAPASLCPVTGSIFVCERPPREHRTPLGDVVPIDHRTDAGDPEVLYAVREPGTDLTSGKRGQVISVHAGLQRPSGLYGDAISLQPGSGPPLPIPMTGGTQAGRYALVGVVKQGSYGAITWTDVDGQSHPVTGLSTTMVPGWTVFWLFGTDGQGPPYDFDKVVIHAGTTSCALTTCAVQGGF